MSLIVLILIIIIIILAGICIYMYLHPCINCIYDAPKTDPTIDNSKYDNAIKKSRFKPRFNPRRYKEPDTLMKPIDISRFLDVINDEYIDESYKFNIANQPLRVLRDSHAAKNNKYVKHVRDNIMDWKKALCDHNIKTEIYVKKIHVNFVKETDTEFIIYAIVALIICNRNLYLEIKYYGKYDLDDEIDLNADDTCTIQMLSLKPISKTRYISEVGTECTKDLFQNLDEQLEYVKKVDDMHYDENLV